MPNCYSLTPKGADQPERLIAIDEKMCAHFGVTPDPVTWFKNWENIEGLGFAMGFDFARQREINPDRADIIDWLEANYTVDAWAEIGRR